jgi:hypothetical protein
VWVGGRRSEGTTSPVDASLRLLIGVEINLISD